MFVVFLSGERMFRAEKGCAFGKETKESLKLKYEYPELYVYGKVTDITNGPNTSPADAQGTGGLFGAGGTS